jgi:hypothetical protein
MPDLTVELLRGPDASHAVEVLEEINRRWALAGRQQGLAMSSMLAEIHGTEEPPPPADDPAAVEDARQFLATQTLIHELWVLQEADVAPADLYASVDTLRRVHRILNREIARADPEVGPDGEVIRHPDEFDDAAAHLAYWSRLALFGRGDQLIAHQLRLAGAMDEDLAQNRYLLIQDALAELRGPWSLEEHLADPVGKQYLEPQPPWPELQLLTSLEVALGRPNQPLAPGELAEAGTNFDAALRAERDRVARDDPPTTLGGLEPSHGEPDYRQRLLEKTRDLADFFSTALELATLAADRVVRVDGRPVSRENVPWIMGLHQDGVRQFNGHAGVISFAGLRITFRPEKSLGAIAVVDAAGIQKELIPETLAATLALLDSPQGLTQLAKLQVGLVMVEENSATFTTGQPMQRPAERHERPRTAAAQHPSAQRPDSTRRGRH